MGAVLPAVLLFLSWDVCAVVQIMQPHSSPNEAWNCNEDLATNIELVCPNHTDWFFVCEISQFHGNCTMRGNGTVHRTYSDVCLGPQPDSRCIEQIPQDELQNTTADYNVTLVRYSCIEGNCGMQLQCNGGLETDTNQTVECGISFLTSDTDSSDGPSTNQASSSSVGLHVHVLGGIAGLSLLVAVTMIIVVLVCGTCGRKEEKEPPPDVKFADPGLDLQHDEHGYCIVNKNRKEAEVASPPEATSSPLDTKSKPKWLNWKLFNRSETNESRRQNVSANKRAKSSSSEENPDTGTLTMNQGGGGDKLVYQILEPDPNAPQGKDVVLVEVPIPRGPKSVKLSAPHTEESTPRGSFHVYSEVGDTSGASVECSSTKNSAKGETRPKKPPKPKSLPPKPKDTRKLKVPPADPTRVYNEITPEESVSTKTYHVLEPDPNEPQEKDLVFIPVQKGKGANFQQSAADKTDSLDSRNLHLYADLDDVEIEGSGAAMSESNSCPVSSTPAGRERPAGGLLTGQTSQTLNNETSASGTDSFHAYADVGDCQVSTDDKNATSSESRDTTDDRNMTSSKSRDKKPGASLYEEVEITPERKMSVK